MSNAGQITGKQLSCLHVRLLRWNLAHTANAVTRDEAERSRVRIAYDMI